MKYYSVIQFAKRYGIKKQGVYERIERGTINAIKTELPTGRIYYAIPADNWENEKTRTKKLKKAV